MHLWISNWISWVEDFAFELVENIVGKEKNAGERNFLLALQCFRKPLGRVINIQDDVVKG